MAMTMTRRPRKTAPESTMSWFDEVAREFFSWGTTPKMCVWEENDELIIQAELPGVKKDSIDVTVDGDMLSITAEKKEHETSEKAVSYTCERPFGTLSRSVSLPFPVDFDKASSHFEDGVLEIRMPKAERARAKRIEIK